jgi:hypothetical protein
VNFHNVYYTALFNDAAKLAQQCFPTMRQWFPLLQNNVPYHAGCLPPRKNSPNRQTDMDESIRCSSLMLEHEEHLKSDKKTVSIMIISHLMMGVEPTPKTLYMSSTSQTMDDVQLSTHKEMYTVTTITMTGYPIFCFLQSLQPNAGIVPSATLLFQMNITSPSITHHSMQ